MFNLLMSGAGWDPDRDSLPRGRVFEHTEADLVERFKPGGTLDVDAVCRLPTLFACESVADQPARVGRITRLRQNGANYEFDYTLERDIPPIPPQVVERLARQLHIGDWELNRTHWAVKDVDLFEVLLKDGIGTRPRPRVFELADVEEADLVAVMMPFDAGFRPVYEALQAAAAATALRIQRADDIWEADQIIQDVVTLISRARVVICDLTRRNPNVFYEMGIAHALGKDVIMVTQEAGNTPFDVAHIRHIRYLANREGLEALTEEVRRRLATLTG